MFHVDNSTGVPVMPQPSPVTSETELFFTEGGNGVPPTYPGPDWFNVIQSELLNILKAAGIDPDKMDNTQILVALKKLFLSRSNPFGDIKADGAAAIAAALTNLRLGAGSPPIGIPFFWPSSVMPNTVMDEWSDMVFLKWNGASFSAATYPKLAKVVPGLILTDTRGEFIRVWDDGRGVDPTTGRALLSWQGDLFKTHSHKLYISAVANASGTNSSDVGSQYESSLVSPYRTLDEGGPETRPRNVAFNFLVRAK